MGLTYSFKKLTNHFHNAIETSTNSHYFIYIHINLFNLLSLFIFFEGMGIVDFSTNSAWISEIVCEAIPMSYYNNKSTYYFY